MQTENLELKEKLGQIAAFEREFGLRGVSFSVRSGTRIPIEAAASSVLSFLNRVAAIVADKDSWALPEPPSQEVLP